MFFYFFSSHVQLLSLLHPYPYLHPHPQLQNISEISQTQDYLVHTSQHARTFIICSKLVSLVSFPITPSLHTPYPPATLNSLFSKHTQPFHASSRNAISFFLMQTTAHHSRSSSKIDSSACSLFSCTPSCIIGLQILVYNCWCQMCFRIECFEFQKCNMVPSLSVMHPSHWGLEKQHIKML